MLLTKSKMNRPSYKFSNYFSLKMDSQISYSFSALSQNLKVPNERRFKPEYDDDIDTRAIY